MSSVMARRCDRQDGDRREQHEIAEVAQRTAKSGERNKPAQPEKPAKPEKPDKRDRRDRREKGPVLRIFPSASHRDHVMAVCDGVIDIAATLFNVSGKDLRSAGRSTLAVSRVRQIAMYVAHVTLGFTMANVGQGFGRDRTTVLHACHQIEDLREDEEFDDIVARVEQVVAAAFGEAA